MKHLRNGFTIIELMITIAVMGILLAIAIPEFQRFIQRTRIDSEILELQSFFMAARGEAIKTGRDVWVTSGGANWTGPLRYFGDIDGLRTQDSNEPTVGTSRARSEIVLVANPPTFIGFGYNSRGEILGAGNLSNDSLGIQVPGHIDFPGYYVGQVSFNNTGRTSVYRFKTPVGNPSAGVKEGNWN